MATDLDRLIEAVEAVKDIYPSDFPKDFPKRQWALRASEGSLDAATTLLDALLPGWEWGRLNGGMFVEQGDSVFSARDPKPARALLLATLRAYRSTREGQP